MVQVAGTVTGNVTMQRYLPSAFGYKYISSPFQAATVNELSDDIDLGASFPTLFSYNESSTTSGWVDYITTADPLSRLRWICCKLSDHQEFLLLLILQVP